MSLSDAVPALFSEKFSPRNLRLPELAKLVPAYKVHFQGLLSPNAPCPENAEGL